MAETKPIKISGELAAKCDASDQFNRFDRLVNRIVAIPAKNAEEIRGLASVNTNPVGRPKKDASRVPDVRPRA
jgi:hypothetical protein